MGLFTFLSKRSKPIPFLPSFIPGKNARGGKQSNQCVKSLYEKTSSLILLLLTPFPFSGGDR